MSMLSHPAFGPRVALIYVTLGALIDVWTAVYYFAYGRWQMQADQPGEGNRVWFWVAGFFLTGVVLIVLGLFLGQLGRAARKAELPPKEAEQEEKEVKRAAAANPNPMIAAQQGVLAPGVAPLPAQPAAAPLPSGAVVQQPVVPGYVPQRA